MVSLGLSLLLSASSVISANGASCTQPDTQATVAALPNSLPAILASANEHGTAQLVVTLSPQSALPSKVEMLESSGYPIVDAAALDVARRTAFTLETKDCAPVGGQYLFAFDY